MKIKSKKRHVNAGLIGNPRMRNYLWSATDFRKVGLVACGLASVFLLGCGPGGPDLGPFGQVQGTVTFQGQSVTKGMITFNCPATGHVGTAEFDSEGSYKMSLNGREGLPLGDYVISIRPPLTAQNDVDPSKRVRNNLYDPSISRDIPMKYRYESSSGFKASVVEGENTFDFEMTPE